MRLNRVFPGDRFGGTVREMVIVVLCPGWRDGMVAEGGFGLGLSLGKNTQAGTSVEGWVPVLVTVMVIVNTLPIFTV